MELLIEDELHDYQRYASNFIIINNNCGVFLEMGLGKTVSTLTAVNELMYRELEVSRALVIAPKRVAETVWDQEILKWDHLKHLSVTKVIGGVKDRETALKQKSDVYIISRDNVAWLCSYYGGLKLPFDMLIVDESSSFKNPDSIRFKSLKKMLDGFKRVVILTATPAPNGLLDLWGQIYLLDKGERLGRTIGEYKRNYLKPSKSVQKENPKTGALINIVTKYKPIKGGQRLIESQINDICVSMKSKDFLDMPDLIENIINVSLPDKILKQYKEFEREKIIEMAEEEITAINAGVLFGKLLQFANGAIYNEEGDVINIHDEKLHAVEEILEANPGKRVIIARSFRHDRDKIMKYFKKRKPVELAGVDTINAWNAGKIDILVMHPASGGHGLNLQAGGHVVIWFGIPNSLELYQQLNGRLHRQGQQSKQVFVHRVATVGTIESDVLNRLKNKEDMQNALINSVKAKIKSYQMT